MRTASLFIECSIFFALALPVQSDAQCLGRTTMNGVWTANDGGTYIIRDSARLFPRRPRWRDVWWLGMSSDGGQTFTNVFKGRRKGSSVTGEWSDVSGHSGFGTMELSLGIPSTGPN